MAHSTLFPGAPQTGCSSFALVTTYLNGLSSFQCPVNRHTPVKAHLKKPPPVAIVPPSPLNELAVAMAGISGVAALFSSFSLMPR